MSVRLLHLLGSPALRQRTRAVDGVTDDVRRLIDDLFETMYAAKGVGLAANQIGETARVAVVDVGDGDPLVLVNPTILERSGEDVTEEGCLSVPDFYDEVARAWTVEIEALDRDGERYRHRAEGLKARAIQHEMDHLDGVLFLDHLSLLKRRLLLAKWRRQRKGARGYLKEIGQEPARNR